MIERTHHMSASKVRSSPRRRASSASHPPSLHTEPTPEPVRAAARRVVAANSDGADQARDLLEMLGLLPGQDVPLP